ncbi:membrane protein [Aquimarina addita]|uniref:Membrane protein n=2 Tax=Aquimarina addita TaxID=870485 RepID=A0ABP7XDX2_9FLAO
MIQLNIKGKDSTETSIIDSISYLKSFQSLSELKKEVQTLQQKLLELGYLDLTSQNLHKKSDTLLEKRLQLNLKYKTLNVFYDPKYIPNEILQKKSLTVTDSSFTIPFHKTKETLQYLTNYLVNQGNTFSNISLNKIQQNNNAIYAQLIVSESQTRTVDDIIIKGYTNFPSSYLKYYTRLKNGILFKKEEIINKSLIIDNLSFAKNIKPPEVLFENDSTRVYLYLEKKSANTFDGFLGFSSDTETGDLEINGYLNLNLVNNLNFGEKLNILYKNDGSEQQRFEANISLPYILKSPIGIEAGLSIFKKDSSFLITNQNVNLNYLITNKANIFVGYSATTSDNLLETPSPTLNINDYTSSFIRAGANYTTRQNNLLFPIKNRYAITTEFGSRKTITETIDQTTGQIDLQYLFRLNGRNSIFISNSAAAILSDNLFVNELLRFGGINSMRGFEENSINASLYNVLNTEYQYILASNLYIHSIIDYSYFEDQTTNLTDNLTSFGFGLGLNTQTGLFKIIFANGKNSDSNFKFSNTKVHISLTARF